MKITRVYLGGVQNLDPVSLQKFADLNDFTMEVHERGKGCGSKRFYAHFSRVEVSDGMMLVGTYGDGADEEEAIKNYAAEIEGKMLVYSAGTRDRKQIQAPSAFVVEEGE